jgi:hypothetical protein
MCMALDNKKSPIPRRRLIMRCLDYQLRNAGGDCLGSCSYSAVMHQDRRVRQKHIERDIIMMTRSAWPV